MGILRRKWKILLKSIVKGMPGVWILDDICRAFFFYFDFIFQQCRSKSYFVRRNPVTVQYTKNVCAVKELKCFVRTLIAKTFFAVRIDMIHKKRNIVLSQAVKGSPFWKDIPYKFMIFFQQSLSVRERKHHNKRYGFLNFPAYRIRSLSD